MRFISSRRCLSKLFPAMRWSQTVRMKKTAGSPRIFKLADERTCSHCSGDRGNLIAKLAHGIADTPSPASLWRLIPRARILMLRQEWKNGGYMPRRKQNVATLQRPRRRIHRSDEGLLSCGYEGLGRLWPVEKIGHTYWNWRANHQPATLAYGLSECCVSSAGGRSGGHISTPPPERGHSCPQQLSTALRFHQCTRHSDFQPLLRTGMSALLDLPSMTSSLWQRVRAYALPAHSLRALVFFRRLLTLLEIPAPEAPQWIRRVTIMERHIMWPIKAAGTQ